MCHAGRVPCVTSLDTLHRAVAGFAVTDPGLVIEPPALAAAQRSLDSAGLLRHEQDLIVPAGPPGAPGMVLIPAIGQRIQDVGVSDDHELNRGLGSHGLLKASRTCRQSLAGAALAEPSMPPCRQLLDPTGMLMTNANFFLIMSCSWRVPLRNRTADRRKVVSRPGFALQARAIDWRLSRSPHPVIQADLRLWWRLRFAAASYTLLVIRPRRTPGASVLSSANAIAAVRLASQRGG